MQANTMFFKVVPQRAGGFNILCGFNDKLVFATAERVTSEAPTLTAERARAIAEKHAADLNAASVLDCTSGSVHRKMEKNAANAFLSAALGTFAGVGIGRYLQ